MGKEIRVCLYALWVRGCTAITVVHWWNIVFVHTHTLAMIHLSQAIHQQESNSTWHTGHSTSLSSSIKLTDFVIVCLYSMLVLFFFGSLVLHVDTLFLITLFIFSSAFFLIFFLSLFLFSFKLCLQFIIFLFNFLLFFIL